MWHEKDLLIIQEQTSLPRAELWFECSHASGPGGQNVNKVSSRVTACLNLDLSPSFTDLQKERLRMVLRSSINRDGILRVSNEDSRSQSRNREAAVARLVELLAGALLRPRKRKASRPSAASRANRLACKKKRSSLKRDRKILPEE